MTRRITLSCLHCGADAGFKVEDWADAPERAYCGQACYQAARTQAPRTEAAVSAG